VKRFDGKAEEDTEKLWEL